MENLKPGDKIRIEWTDGLDDVGIFVRMERGFLVYNDESGKQGACASGHAKISVIETSVTSSS